MVLDDNGDQFHTVNRNPKTAVHDPNSIRSSRHHHILYDNEPLRMLPAGDHVKGREHFLLRTLGHCSTAQYSFICIPWWRAESGSGEGLFCVLFTELLYKYVLIL